MHKLFKDVPGAIENTRKIEESIDFKITTGVYHLPNFPIPEDESDPDPDIYLKKLNREKDKKPNDYNKGAYLGDVSTGSSYVNILCRDFEYVDGDRVRISVNDSIVIYNLYTQCNKLCLFHFLDVVTTTIVVPWHMHPCVGL